MTQKLAIKLEQWARFFGNHRDRCRWGKLAGLRRKEDRQRRGSQYARDRRGEPGRNGGPKGV